MMEDNKDNEVYYLGKSQKRNLRKWWWVALLGIVALFALAQLWTLNGGNSIGDDTLKGETLQTVSVLPEGAAMPRFNGDGDMNDFLVWIMQNLKYPQGLEKEKARVVIRFVVQTDGKLGQFEVMDAPKQKAFEQQVINLLKESPDWTPAKLSDGKSVNMEFTLPVEFRQAEN